MDTVITLGDITLPAGATAIAEPETPLVTVLITREEPEPEVEAAEGEEGEGAEAADGDAAEGAAAEGDAAPADSGE
jgi:large subunit ribosomal protein L25